RQQGERRCPDDAWLSHIRRERCKRTACACRTLASSIDDRAIVRLGSPVRSEPSGHLVGSPLRRTVGMTIVAGIRRIVGDRKIGPRNADSMIAANIDDHV